MAKKKTRKQKILADSRHITYHLETNYSAQVSHPTEKKSKFNLEQISTPTTVIANSYAHVAADIKKTAFITGAILTAQIILFILINKV